MPSFLELKLTEIVLFFVVVEVLASQDALEAHIFCSLKLSASEEKARLWMDLQNGIKLSILQSVFLVKLRISYQIITFQIIKMYFSFGRRGYGSQVCQ